MNGPFVVAQATGAATPVATAPRVVKVLKPDSNQAVTIQLSYDQSVKLDLSAIGNEKITLVHIGEKLIILFDNSSTVTVQPFFDSMNVPLTNITVEAADGRILPSGEFAAVFPITTDQSVLPAAGEGGPGSPASGASFSNASVEGLFSPNPLPLLPPEALPGFNVNFPDSVPPLQTVVISAPLLSPLAGENPLVQLDDDNLPNGNPGFGVNTTDGAGTDDIAPLNETGTLAHDYQGAPGTTLLTGAGLPTSSVTEGAFIQSVSADGLTLTISQIQGGVSVAVLQVQLIDTTSGAYTVTELHAIDHPAGLDENNVQFTVAYQVTTGGGVANGTLPIDVDDDAPVALAQPEGIHASVVEDALSTTAEPTDLSEGNLDAGQTTADDEASSTSSGTLTSLFSAGADEPLIYGVSSDTSGLPTLYSHGELVVYAVSPDGTTLTGSTSFGTVFTLTVSADGSWTFDLDDQLDHVDASGDAGFNLITSADGGSSVSSIDFSSVIVAADADGDPATGATSGSFTIAVQNDVPVPVSEPDGVHASVVEDALSTTVEPTDLSEGNLDAGQDTSDDEASSTSSGTLTSLFSAGADEPLIYGVSSDTSGLPTLYSHGELVVYAVSPDGTTLTGSTSFGTVFTLTVSADGSWTFDLDDQLDHVDASGDAGFNLITSADGGSSVSSIDFSSVIVATDADGDPATGATSGSFTIAVQNDVPVPVSEPDGVHASVVEDALSTTAEPTDLSEGNLDAGQDTSDDEASSTSFGTLTSLFLAGADEPLIYGVSSDTSGLPTLYSHGELVVYAVSPDGTTLTGSTSFGTVFTLTVSADGSWTFDLDDQLDHVDASGDAGFNLITSADGGSSVSSIDFSSVIVATDADGDPATGATSGSFTIAVQNDVPVPVSEPDGVHASVVEDALSTTVEPTDLSEGNLDAGQTTADDEASSTSSGTLTSLFSAGADEPLIYGVSSDTSGLPTLYSHGELVVYAVSPDGTTLTGSTSFGTVFTLTVSADGSWTFDLDDQLDHVDASGDAGFNLITSADGGSSVSSIDFSSVIVATDADGDPATGATSGSFTIAVQNDVPVPVSEPDGVHASVVEDALSTTVEPTDLSEGNLDAGQTTADDEASSTSSGTLTSLFSAGADEPLIYGVSSDTSGLPTLYSHGELVVYAVSPDGTTLTGSTSFGTVFTLTVSADGSWTFDLDDQLDHVDASGDAGFNLITSADGGSSVSSIDFSSVIVATDADGDPATGATSGSFTIAVQNDVPVPVSEPDGVHASVVEDALSTTAEPTDLSEGNLDAGQDTSDDEASSTSSGTLTSLFSAGADEPLIYGVSSDTSGLPTLYSHGELVVYAVSPDGTTLTGSTSFGTVFTLTVSADGSWTFDLDDQLDHVDASGDAGFNLITSADGGSSVSSIDFSSVIVAADADGDPATGATSGSFTIAVQNDVPVPVSEPDGVHATVVEDALSTTAEPTDLSEGNLDAGQDTSDDEASSTSSGTLTSLFSAGADEPLIYGVSSDTSGLPTLYSHGELVVYAVSPDGTTLTGSTSFGTVFTLTVSADGSWTFDLDDQLDHVDASGDAGFNLITSADGGSSVSSIDFSSVIVATDADGDPATGATSGSFTIAVQNDVPVPVSEPDGVHASVVEDALSTTAEPTDLSEGNLDAGQDTSDDEASSTSFGTLTSLFLAGADEPLIYGVSSDTSGLPTLYSHGELVVYAVSPDGTTLTGSTSFGTVFTLTVSADGSWTFDLDDQLDHVDASGDAGFNLITSADGGSSVSSIDFSSVIVATDADGDPATGATSGSFTIAVQNDVPVIAPSEECVDTPLTYSGVIAGNVDQRGLDGPDDHDLLLSAIGFNQGNGNPDNEVNTTVNDIGVADQHIHGQSVQGGGPNQTIIPPELLRIDFANSVQINGGFSYNGHYTVDAASFTIYQIQGAPTNTATVFVQVFDANDNNNFADDGNPLPINVSDITVTNDSDNTYALTPVYDGATIIGIVISGLDDGAVVTVNTAADFDRLVVSNYDGVTANTSATGDPVTFDGGSPFSISGITSVVCEPVTLTVSHDESPGFTPQSGPNPENDVNSLTAPPTLTAAITGAGIAAVLGYAVSQGSAASLFTSQPGADEPANISYQLSTSTAGGLFNGVDSGLNTTVDNNDIFLFSDPGNPDIVWGVDSNDFATGEKVFALYIDDGGQLWVAQFLAIAHDVDGSSAAAYDDIVSITNGLVYVTATITDADNDQAYAVSPAGLKISFQDDGPAAVSDTNWTVEDSSAAVTGNALLDLSHPGDPSATLSFADVGDTLGTDGGKVTNIAKGAGSPVAVPAGVAGVDIAGSYGHLVIHQDGSYSYTLGGSGTNTAAVQALDESDAPLQDVFTYTVTDGDDDTSIANLTISVFGTNDAPVANADTNWAKEDTNLTTSGNVLLNQAHNGAPSGTFADVADTDVDVEPLTVTTTGTFSGLYGTLVLNSNGSYSYTLYTQGQNASAYATMQALDTNDAPLTDVFNYTASDGTTTASSTLTVTMFGTNDAPVANADTNWTKEDAADASGNVLATLAHAGAPVGDVLRHCRHRHRRRDPHRHQRAGRRREPGGHGRHQLDQRGGDHRRVRDADAGRGRDVQLCGERRQRGGAGSGRSGDADRRVQLYRLGRDRDRDGDADGDDLRHQRRTGGQRRHQLGEGRRRGRIGQRAGDAGACRGSGRHVLRHCRHRHRRRDPHRHQRAGRRREPDGHGRHQLDQRGGDHRRLRHADTGRGRDVQLHPQRRQCGGAGSGRPGDADRRVHLYRLGRDRERDGDPDGDDLRHQRRTGCQRRHQLGAGRRRGRLRQRARHAGACRSSGRHVLRRCRHRHRPRDPHRHQRAGRRPEPDGHGRHQLDQRGGDHRRLRDADAGRERDVQLHPQRRQCGGAGSGRPGDADRRVHLYRLGRDRERDGDADGDDLRHQRRAGGERGYELGEGRRRGRIRQRARHAGACRSTGRHVLRHCRHRHRRRDPYRHQRAGRR